MGGLSTGWVERCLYPRRSLTNCFNFILFVNDFSALSHDLAAKMDGMKRSLLAFLLCGTSLYAFEWPYHRSGPAVRTPGAVQRGDVNLSRLKLNEREMLQFASLSAKHEYGGDPKGVVMWNKYENFLSLGIGHYLWGRNSGQGESFREMIKYVHSTGCYRGAYPSVLKFRDGSIGGMPWGSKKSFEASESSAQVKELKSFLLGKDMQVCQVKFQMNRLQAGLSKMLQKEATNFEFKKTVNELASSEAGVVAMLDYVNFKGEGLSEKRRGNWGLFEVLRRASVDPNVRAVNKFKAAAINVLKNREDWSTYGPGWTKRIVQYGNSPGTSL